MASLRGIGCHARDSSQISSGKGGRSSRHQHAALAWPSEIDTRRASLVGAPEFGRPLPSPPMGSRRRRSGVATAAQAPATARAPPGSNRHTCLHLVEAFDDGAALFTAAERHGLEGIVSKRTASVFRSGPSRGVVELPFGRVPVVNPGASRDLLAHPPYGQVKRVVLIVATLRVEFRLIGR